MGCLHQSSGIAVCLGLTAGHEIEMFACRGHGRIPPLRIGVWVRGVAQEIRRTSKVASSRKFPPQKAVTCCIMAR
jgi:hypothetical protein